MEIENYLNSLSKELRNKKQESKKTFIFDPPTRRQWNIYTSNIENESHKSNFLYFILIIVHILSYMLFISFLFNSILEISVAGGLLSCMNLIISFFIIVDFINSPEKLKNIIIYSFYNFIFSIVNFKIRNKKQSYKKLHSLYYKNGEYYRAWYILYVLRENIYDHGYKPCFPSFYELRTIEYSKMTEEIPKITNQANFERKHWINSLPTTRFLSMKEFKMIQKTERSLEEFKKEDRKIKAFEEYMKNKRN